MKSNSRKGTYLPPTYGETMRTWRYRHFSTILETAAKTPEKAGSNFRWQLFRDCGMSRFAAMHEDINPIVEVQK